MIFCLLSSNIIFHVSSQASLRFFWRKLRSCGKSLIDILSNNQHQAKEQRREIKYQPWKRDKLFIFFLLIMTEDSETLSLDLANDFPEAEESQTLHKEPSPKKIYRQRTGSPITKLWKY